MFHITYVGIRCIKLIVIPFIKRVKAHGVINKSGVRDRPASVKSTDYHEAPRGVAPSGSTVYHP